MEYVMGIKGKGFAMVCVSSTAVQQIITMKHEEDKCMAVDSHRMLVTSGEPGDRVQFGDFICANIRLRNMRHQVTTSTKAVASYARQELAKALRQKPYQANLLVAGYDKGKGDASLYYLDYIATLKEMNVSGYGYGSWFVLSMFDRLWHPDLTEAEGLDMMMKGIEEVKRRLSVAPASFMIKVVDKDGIRHLATINPDEKLDKPPDFEA